MPNLIPKVLIPLAMGCEDIESVTLIDLLRRANIDVTTVSLDDNPVTCARGTVIIADTSLDKVINNSFDLMVLPGGLPGADNLNSDPRIHQLINRLFKEDKYIGAICAAPKVLIENGLFGGKRLTAYPGTLDAVDTSKVILSNNNVEIDGKVITSKGPGTAMDFALALIEVLLGKEVRDDVEISLQRS